VPAPRQRLREQRASGLLEASSSAWRWLSRTHACNSGDVLAPARGAAETPSCGVVKLHMNPRHGWTGEESVPLTEKLPRVHFFFSRRHTICFVSSVATASGLFGLDLPKSIRALGWL
jgi:hypothetical protein